jgi:hypothetical protein
MENVIRMPPPRERTPQVIAALRGATVKDVRKRLADHSRISAKTWVHIGKCLIDVRSDHADQGAFAAMFAVTAKERKDEQRFPFSYSRARMLMCIAESDVCTANNEKLPPGIDALYQLSKLTRAKLETLIDSGAIHPMMTRAEASKLAGTKSRKKPPAERTYERAYDHHRALLRKLDKERRAREVLSLMHDCGITIHELQEIEK